MDRNAFSSIAVFFKESARRHLKRMRDFLSIRQKTLMLFCSTMRIWITLDAFLFSTKRDIGEWFIARLPQWILQMSCCKTADTFTRRMRNFSANICPKTCFHAKGRCTRSRMRRIAWRYSKDTITMNGLIFSPEYGQNFWKQVILSVLR